MKNATKIHNEIMTLTLPGMTKDVIAIGQTVWICMKFDRASNSFLCIIEQNQNRRGIIILEDEVHVLY